MYDAATLAAELREELAAALDRFAYRSPWLFEFDGEPVTVSAAAGPAGDHAPLLQALQATFYNRCYARRSGLPGMATAADPGFAGRLAAANAGREGWIAAGRSSRSAPAGRSSCARASASAWPCQGPS